MDLEYGYRKCNSNNMPKVRDDTVFKFIAKSASNNNDAVNSTSRKTDEDDLHVDYVQVRKTAEIIDINGIVFKPADIGGTEPNAKVALKIDLKKDEIVETSCDKCGVKSTCADILAFIFWLYRKSNDSEAAALHEFWGDEVNNIVEEQQQELHRLEAVRVRDILSCDDLRLEADMELTAVRDTEGTAFLEAMLDGMEELGLRDSQFYRHCRPVTDEFETIFIHHTMLDSANNGITDSRSFFVYMEEQAKQGLLDRFADASKESYKTQLWYEAQYMRLRCSLIQSIAARKTSVDEEQILEQLFCKNRCINQEARQQLKQHKRFILKQTERLENKTYHECGLLISESYPYICASPDGITDDHIVEIKSPKTEEEFERYLEGRETIAPKYMAQIQIQMYVANVTKALYCVLSPTFDTNGALHYVWVQADMEFVASLLSAAEDFWKEIVYPRLCKIYPYIQ